MGKDVHAVARKLAAFKQQLKQRWIDPVKKAEDIFRVRRADGSLVPLKLPGPHKRFLRSGILGKGMQLLKKNLVYRRVNNKGRQEGYSIISAIEAILIADKFPDTFQYYIAVRGDQGVSWLQKVEQLVRDAKDWPDEVGGGHILKWNEKEISKKTEKIINRCAILCLTANPAGIRGDTAINVILDEFAWMIMRKNQQDETYTAIKYFLRQGGQITVNSTPRVTNDRFWTFYSKANELGFDALYNPAIENWKELDLNSPLFIDFDNNRRKLQGQKILSNDDKKKYENKYLTRNNYVYDEKLLGIRQFPVKIPYPWVSIIDLEIDRADDLELFKQENLGIPVDEMYKLIMAEWIYPNCIEYNPETGEGTDWIDRRDSYNTFAMGIDFASKRDLTVATVGEKIGDHWYERACLVMQGDYSVQEDKIVAMQKAFKCAYIATDYTNEKSLSDRLERVLGKNLIRKVVFTNTTKAHLAQHFRRVASNNRYHALNHTPDHERMIKHVLKVEKQVGDTSVKYTGKGVDSEGRDDGFWSKALMCFDAQIEKGEQVVRTKLAMGKARRLDKADVNKHKNDRLYRQVVKDRETITESETSQNKSTYDERVRKLKAVFSSGIILCKKQQKPIKPYKCMCVGEPNCPNFDMHKRECAKLGFTQEEAERILNGQKEN